MAGTSAKAGTSTRAPELGTALVLWLNELGQAQLPLAGGKGANLGELVQAGFPVPPGFVVTTTAYERLLADGRLHEIIEKAHGKGDSGASIRDAIERARVSADIEEAIATAYRQLGGGAVAVRSSATAEDLPEATFAGQQDTFLNMIGDEAVLDAVKRCWASLWTERAVAYRHRQGVDRQGIKLAVVVQSMVPAEVAGVMFTANPVTGARDEIVIDASPGLGEAVVSGLVTPDQYVTRRRPWGLRVSRRQAGRRELVVQAKDGGGTERVAPDAAAAARLALPDSAVRRLSALGRQIERHFGCPQDIEWAWAGGQPFIVQARPMTALPKPVSRRSRVQRQVALMAAEIAHIRPYPLDLTLWGPGIVGAISPVFELLGLRMLPVDRWFTVDDSVVIQFRKGVPVRPTWKLVLAPARLARLICRYDPVAWQADLRLAGAQERVGALAAQDLDALSWPALLDTAREAAALPRDLAGELRRRYFPRASLALGLLRPTLGILGRSDLFGVLLSGVATKTLETNRALEGLAARIRADPALAEIFAGHHANELWTALERTPSGQAFLAELQTFLNYYGHREAVIMTAAVPSWSDAPQVVLGMLRGLAASPPREERDRPTWEEAREELLADPRLRFPPPRAALLELIEQARCLMQIREDTHFYATLALPFVRRAVLELGRRLVGVAALESPEDVFHLTIDELEHAGHAWPPSAAVVAQLRSSAARRKVRRAALEGTPLLDPGLFGAAAVAGNVVLRATPGSPGVASGPARIVRDGTEFGKLLPGDVLVAPYTNPSWTPLFERAAAIVVDSGGAGSHAAIVAREYGIPAVMGSVDGTRRIVDDERIQVDGSRGVVMRLGR